MKKLLEKLLLGLLYLMESSWGVIIVCGLALLGLETIGMDGMIVVLCWLVMAVLGLGFIGEIIHRERMNDFYRRNPHLFRQHCERIARLREGRWD